MLNIKSQLYFLNTCHQTNNIYIKVLYKLKYSWPNDIVLQQSKFSKLIKLDISDNPLVKNILHLKHLQYLIMEGKTNITLDCIQKKNLVTLILPNAQNIFETNSWNNMILFNSSQIHNIENLNLTSLSMETDDNFYSELPLKELTLSHFTKNIKSSLICGAHFNLTTLCLHSMNAGDLSIHRNLTSLFLTNCTYNGINKLSNLTDLTLWDDKNIDVIKMPLIRLNLRSCHNITSINISTLDCLHLESLPNITRLKNLCLTELCVTECPQLIIDEMITLKKLVLGNNTRIDQSAINNLDLNTLCVQYNNTINSISHLTNLKKLSIGESITLNSLNIFELTSLSILNNNISCVNHMTNLIKLRLISCDKITSLDLPNLMCLNINDCDNIEYINLPAINKIKLKECACDEKILYQTNPIILWHCIGGYESYQNMTRLKVLHECYESYNNSSIDKLSLVKYSYTHMAWL